MQVFTLAVLLAAIAPAPAIAPTHQEELILTVMPRVSHDPGVFRVRAQIEPNDANRSVTLTFDGADYYGSSTIQLDGSAGPALVVRQFDQLPPGVYSVEARVERNDGRVVMRRDEATVVGTRR